METSATLLAHVALEGLWGSDVAAWRFVVIVLLAAVPQESADQQRMKSVYSSTKETRSSAIAEGLRDVPCQLKPC